jgi:hypothetical protein
MRVDGKPQLDANWPIDDRDFLPKPGSRCPTPRRRQQVSGRDVPTGHWSGAAHSTGRDMPMELFSEWCSRFYEKMARPKRFELLTPRFVVWCSIQLS